MATSGSTAPGTAGAHGGYDGGCVDRVICLPGTHSDPAACACVPDDDAGTDAGDGDARCIGKVLCTRWAHFDPDLCRCVDDDASPGDEPAPEDAGAE